LCSNTPRLFEYVYSKYMLMFPILCGNLTYVCWLLLPYSLFLSATGLISRRRATLILHISARNLFWFGLASSNSPGMCTSANRSRKRCGICTCESKDFIPFRICTYKKRGRRPSTARIISRHPSRALPQTPWNLHLRNQRPYLQQNVHLRKKEEGGYGSCGLFRFLPEPAASTGAGRLSLFLPWFRLYNARPSCQGDLFLAPAPYMAASPIRR
jgi:hypothetical protein